MSNRAIMQSNQANAQMKVEAAAQGAANTQKAQEKFSQDLVNKSESDMMKIRNLGKKSLKEVIDKVKSMGLTFRDED